MVDWVHMGRVEEDEAEPLKTVAGPQSPEEQLARKVESILNIGALQESRTTRGYFDNEIVVLVLEGDFKNAKKVCKVVKRQALRR